MPLCPFQWLCRDTGLLLLGIAAASVLAVCGIVCAPSFVHQRRRVPGSGAGRDEEDTFPSCSIKSQIKKTTVVDCAFGKSTLPSVSRWPALRVCARAGELFPHTLTDRSLRPGETWGSLCSHRPRERTKFSWRQFQGSSPPTTTLGKAKLGNSQENHVCSKEARKYSPVSHPSLLPAPLIRTKLHFAAPCTGGEKPAHLPPSPAGPSARRCLRNANGRAGGRGARAGPRHLLLIKPPALPL